MWTAIIQQTIAQFSALIRVMPSIVEEISRKTSELLKRHCHLLSLDRPSLDELVDFFKKENDVAVNDRYHFLRQYEFFSQL